MLAAQSSTVISWSANHIEVVLALWAAPKVLLEKEISICIKLVSRWKHKVLQSLLLDGCIDFGLDNTQWTDTSRCHSTLNHHWLWKLHTGLQATWILFQKWLGSPFPEDVWAWWLLTHCLQLQFTPCEALPSVWIGFAWPYSQAYGHPSCLYTFFSTQYLSSSQLCIEYILIQHSVNIHPFSNSVMVFWTIAKSAVSPIIVVSKNKRYPVFILYAWSFIETKLYIF